MRFTLPEIPDKLRAPLAYAGYALFGLLAYAAVIYLTFPYDRVKDRLEAELASSEDVEVTIGRLGPSPLFGVSASDVVIQKKEAGAAPSAEKKKGARIVIDRVSVSVSPLGLLFGRRSIGFSGRAFGGKFSGSFSESKEERSISLSVSGIQAVSLPWLKDLLEVPVAGAISGELDLTMPKKRLGQASGSLELGCKGCSIGDGKARIKIAAAAAMFPEGVLVDKTSLGTFGGRIVIDKGVAKIQSFGAKSPDGELAVEGEIMLAESVGLSTIRTGYVTFRPSDAAKKKQPYAMMDMALGQSAKRADGFFGWRVSGLLKKPVFVASKTSPIQPAGLSSFDRSKRPEPPGGRRLQLGSGTVRPPGTGVSPSAGLPPLPPGRPPLPPPGGPPRPGADTPPPDQAKPEPPAPAPPPPPPEPAKPEQPGQPELPPAQPEPSQPEQPVQPEQPSQPE